MTDSLLTDDAILARLGERLAQVRLGRDLTQRQLADEAGVGKTVVERLENGKSITLANFVRVLRALDRIDQLLLVAPEPTLRPAELAQRSGRPRRRASRPRDRGRDGDPAGPFRWGDERAASADGAPSSAERHDAGASRGRSAGTESRG